MKRKCLEAFKSWLNSNSRQPLVLRGARQVGKTWLVRDLAKSASLTLLELNFERNPEYVKLFSARSPQAIYDDITLQLNTSPPPQQALLFLDEIQSAPELLAQLRWFSEEMPELAVVAAGSLLEFALATMRHSMPVGRIRYGFLEPMSFEEYLIAHQQDGLLERWASWQPGADVSDALHTKTLEHFDCYQMTGGMPAVVSAAVNGDSAAECRQIQRDLIQTYRDDFFKYAGRMQPGILNATLLASVHEMGKKFVYSHVDESIRHSQAKQALELLAMSRLCTLIPHTQANGLPLSAETNERIRKVSLLDVGLAHGLWNTPAAASYPSWSSLSPMIRGNLTEQIVAQQLRIALGGFGWEGQLYHWRREGGRSGEIDFVVEINGSIVPIEVKSGATGSMKSLHQFMYDKQLPLALRLDRNPPSLQTLKIRTTQGNDVNYQLLNLPHYLIWKLADPDNITQAAG
jgi:predicted AAA+ superfamily ATPase